MKSLKSLFPKDLSPRAILAVVAAALLATVVSGREAPVPLPDGTPAARSSAARSAAPLPDSRIDFDLEKLHRPAKDVVIGNLFEPRNFAPPPPQAAIAAQPGRAAQRAQAPPVAPALPFQYIGKLQDGDKLAVFLTRGDENYSVTAGQMIDTVYRVETVSEAAVVLTYLPLGVRQTLQIHAGNHAASQTGNHAASQTGN